MRFQTELVPAILERRYKRFLADARLEDGRQVTAHCPNPGAMTGLAEPGTQIWLEPNDDPRKKLKYGWRLTALETGLVCIDTSLANRVVGEALDRSELPVFAAYPHHRAEVPYAENARVDFLLSGDGQPDLYLEVKSVTLSRQHGLAEFPDTKTARGAKHLAALAQMVARGHRAAVLYVVMRDDCSAMALAADIDPAYVKAHIVAQGVETFCHAARLSLGDIQLGSALSFGES